MPESVYVHIPFCKSKCKYCSFVSYTKPELQRGYIFSLLKEISENYGGESLKTLYFGGGTPSLIEIGLLDKVIKKFNLSPDCEITLELNPDDCSLEYLDGLKRIGVNRLSIGSQTFDDKILKLIGRRHSSEDILNTVNQAKKSGFDNISVDLIYGLPTQTLEGLKKDLEKFLSLDIKHISTYGLKIEEESVFGKNPPKDIADEDKQADMYECINDILESEGFLRYEISNFAKQGFESKHNLNYWNNSEYYGFGVAAHGYVDGIRYSNICSVEDYIKNPVVHETGQYLSKDEMLEEEIFLGFRKTEGINIAKIKENFGIDFENKYSDILRKYAEYIERSEKGYTLNLKGVLISNFILSEFMLDM